MVNPSVIEALFPKAALNATKVAFIPENFEVTSVEHLLFAEEVLDAMDASLVEKTHYGSLYSKADAFVTAHPELLTKPWLRTAGAVHDILESQRQAKGISPPLPALPANCH